MLKNLFLLPGHIWQWFIKMDRKKGKIRQQQQIAKSVFFSYLLSLIVWAGIVIYIVITFELI